MCYVCNNICSKYLNMSYTQVIDHIKVSRKQHKLTSRLLFCQFSCFYNLLLISGLIIAYPEEWKWWYKSLVTDLSSLIAMENGDSQKCNQKCERLQEQMRLCHKWRKLQIDQLWLLKCRDEAQGPLCRTYLLHGRPSPPKSNLYFLPENGSIRPTKTLLRWARWQNPWWHCEFCKEQRSVVPL